MNVEAMKAADILYRHGISVEVINSYSISHIDTRIAESVKKTGNCIIADNDWLYCGFSSELSSFINEKCFGKLKSPISRIGFAPIPCPCARPLENEFYPNAEEIIREVELKLDIPHIDLSNEDFYSYENKFRGPF
jgi:pyruvate dehydrogenase E1 component beta subunit